MFRSPFESSDSDKYYLHLTQKIDRPIGKEFHLSSALEWCESFLSRDNNIGDFLKEVTSCNRATNLVSAEWNYSRIEAGEYNFSLESWLNLTFSRKKIDFKSLKGSEIDNLLRGVQSILFCFNNAKTNTTHTIIVAMVIPPYN
jgi:hypothetical protein